MTIRKVNLLFFLLVSFANLYSQQTEFRLKFTSEVSTSPITGRAILILSKDTLTDPDLPNPYQQFITFGKNFNNWEPGEILSLSDYDADSYMSSINELDGFYSLRVVIDTDTTSSLLLNDGIIYSDKIIFKTAAGQNNIIDIKVNHILTGRGFKEREGIELLRLRSELLSNFCNIPTYIEAAVILPDSYKDEPGRYYPVVFVFPGWGTTHIAPSKNDFQQKRYGMKGFGEEKIFVFLNQDCRFGFHVFADSDNNGPRATSFITEFIPFLESKYRVVKNAGGRFLIGQSSGAWAAIWLQVHYPDMFGMTWAGSPDPIDFRDFIGHNLYVKNANLFYDSDGNLIPAVRTPGVNFTYKEWADMETVLGEGGQFQSFEAVFGRRNPEGKPEQVFDRRTGEIFQKALEHWKNYDINIFIQKNSGELKNKLANKLNIVVADNDDYFLDGSVRQFKKTLDSLGFETNIKFLKEGGHNTWNDELRQEMHSRMDAVYLSNRE